MNYFFDEFECDANEPWGDESGLGLHPDYALCAGTCVATPSTWYFERMDWQDKRPQCDGQYT